MTGRIFLFFVVLSILVSARRAKTGTENEAPPIVGPNIADCYSLKKHNEEPEDSSLILYEEFLNLQYSSRDIRHSRKGDTIYAILPGIPEPGQSIELKTCASDLPEGRIQNVQITGSDRLVVCKKSENGLIIEPPDELVNDMALVYRIETRIYPNPNRLEGKT